MTLLDMECRKYNKLLFKLSKEVFLFTLSRWNTVEIGLVYEWSSCFVTSHTRRCITSYTVMFVELPQTSCFVISYRYNHLMFADYREPLVEVAAQLLVVLLDHETMQQAAATMSGTDVEHSFEVSWIIIACCMHVAFWYNVQFNLLIFNSGLHWAKLRIISSTKWRCAPSCILSSLYIFMHMYMYMYVAIIKQNDNKMLESDWFSVGPICTLI